MSDTILRFSAPLEILQAAAGDDPAKPAKFSAMVYGGGLMPIGGWGDVAVDLAGLSLPPSLPVLSDHNDNLDGIAGSGKPSIDRGKLVVNGVLSRESAVAQKIISLSKTGVEFGASIGVEPLSKVYIQAGESVSVNGRSLKSKKPFTLIKSGRLREVSILAVPADFSTSVSISAKGKFSMAKEQEDDCGGYVVTGQLKERLQANFRSATVDPDLEEQRLKLIRGWCPTFKNASPEIQAKATELREKAINGEISLDELRLGALELVRAERPPMPAIYGSSRDKEPLVLQAAFSRSAGLPNLEKHFKPEILEAADCPQARGFGLQELLLLAAGANGYVGRHAINNGNIREVLEYAFPPRLMKGAFSLHSLTTMLTTTGNKMLLDGFNVLPQSWREVAATRPLKDFKAATAYRLTADLSYEEVPPGGEIHHGTVGQESYTLQAKTYARMLVLTRQDIINDDLGAFNDLRTRLGMGAAIALNKAFWTAWLTASNAGTFWTAALGNLSESSALAEAGMNSALALFRALAGPDGNMMNLEPDRLLVPPSLESTARKLYVSMEQRDTTANTKFQTANIYFNRFRPVIVPELEAAAYTGYSPTTWWLICNPAILASAAVGFLDGQESPTIESTDADFDTLGIQFRGYHDFGVSMSEYRASVKATA